MHKYPSYTHICTGLSVSAIVVAFVMQAQLMVTPQPRPSFSVVFRNIAFGYHTAANLCIGHAPNGATTGSEQCDDGNSSNLDACLNTCKNAACGDGYVRSGSEGCDDADTSSGDGCSASCAVESGYGCSGTAPSVCAPLCVADDDDLEAFLRLDETSGSTAEDTSDNSYDGTWVNTPTSSSDTATLDYYNPASLDFDGTSYVTMGDVLDMGTSDMTVSLWFKTTDSNYSLFSKSFFGSAASRYYLGNDGSGLTAGFHGSSLSVTTPALSGLSNGAWHHAVVVFDRDSTMKLYIDGDNDASVSIASQSSYNLQSAYHLFLARYNDGSTGTAPHASTLALDGQIDDVRFYSRALTSGEITAMYAGSCPETVCGDGIKTSGEGCDDDDTSSGDGCSATCTVESGWSCSGSTPSVCAEVCGNGVVTASEECDDGNTSDSDGCSSTCDEESGYACSGAPSECETECGDGIVAGAEVCDDGNGVNTDGCTNACIASTCGDGIIQAGTETCDDAGESATCDDNCTAVACGDQTINETADEECDDGNSANTDACVSCQVAECGDGFIRNGNEACEPPGVGTCSAICTIQSGIGGGTRSSSSSSSSTRQSPPSFCGNAVVEPEKGEKCDEGSWKNRTSPTCDPWCGTLRCGDGWIHPESEECEPERDEDGSFVVRTCGERSCTIPQCDEEGMCIGGCRWVFLLQCKNITLKPAAGTATGATLSGATINTSSMPWLEAESSSSASAESSSGQASGESTSSMPWLEAESSSSASAESSSRQASGESTSSSSRSAVAVAVAICGNSIVENDEECDNGNTNSDTRANTCRRNCRYAYCGDTVVDAGEQCDDGNDVTGDGCTPECTIAICGNGFLEKGEECDEGVMNSDTEPDRCSTQCIMPRCGDGIVDPGFNEQCDQGEFNSNKEADRCRLDCQPPRCGDGVIDNYEFCDDGNLVDNDGCNSTCGVPECGNGIVDAGETCDDKNVRSGDGCSAQCVGEPKTFLDWLREQMFAPFRPQMIP